MKWTERHEWRSGKFVISQHGKVFGAREEIDPEGKYVIIIGNFTSLTGAAQACERQHNEALRARKRARAAEVKVTKGKKT